MKEKESLKESGEDQIPRVDPDAPGLPAGEELTIDPVSGDEIDPIRKWWDEAEATSREKARNRRLEELEAGAEGILDAGGQVLPRRRKRVETLKIEVEDIPGLPGPKATTAPVMIDQSPLLPVSEGDIEAETAAESGDEAEGLSLEGFSVAPLKRHAREEGEPEDFDLAELFGSKSGEVALAETSPADSPGDDQAESDSGDDDKVDPVEPSGTVSDESGVTGSDQDDPGFDLGDLFKPLPEKEASALHFEFPDFEDESAVPAVGSTKLSEGDDEPTDEAPLSLAPELGTESAPALVDLPVPVEMTSEERDDSAPATEAALSPAAIPVGETETPDESGKDELFPIASDAEAEEAAEVQADEATAINAPPERIAVPVIDDAIGEKEPEIDSGSETEASPVADGDQADAEAGADSLAHAANSAEEKAEGESKQPDSPVEIVSEKAAEPAEPEPSGKAKVLPSQGEPLPEPDPEPAPAGEVALPAAGLTEPRRKAGCWTVFATLFFLATLLLVAVIGVAGWFAWSRLGDFETELTSRVRADLEKKGIFLDYGDWGYRFPRGLVFDEITIFDDATRQRPLIRASGVGLNVDLLALAKAPGELSAGEINLQDSTLALYEAGNPVSTIEGIDGEILAGREEVRVDRISALLGGWQVTINGTVTLPQSSGDPGESTAPAADGDTAAAPLTLDFSAFKALEPWFALGSSAGNAPELDLAISMDAAQPDLATIEGTVNGRDVIWQGVDIASVTATFNVVPETGELSVPSFQIGYGQGFIGGRLAIDTATQRLRIEQLQSTVDVLALLGQYKPAWMESWKSIRLVDAPSFQVTGEIPLEDPAGADLKIRYDHRQGIVVTVEKGELPLRDLRGNFAVNRGSIETNDAGFELFGGSVHLNGATRLTDESRPFNGLIEITGLSMEKAATFFGKAESGMSGRLSFVFRGVGYSDIQKIRGGGTLRVEEAVIPDFPVLGQIQDYVGRAVPAFGVKGQGNITGAYIIESGVLVASDLTVANTAARIVTNGSVNLSSFETDFTARAELVPSLAAATGLSDKTITFAGKGPLDDPAVTLKTFPIEFASVSLGSILGTSPRSLGTLQIVPGVEEAVRVFADQLGGPGITIHPEVTTFFKSLLGEEVPAPEEAPAPQEE